MKPNNALEYCPDKLQAPVSPVKPISSDSEKDEGIVSVPVTYCPHCHRAFKIKPAWEGKKTRCSKCDTHFNVKVIWRRLKKKKIESSPNQMCCVYCERQFESLEKPILIDNEPVCNQCKEGLENGDTILAERNPFKKKLRRMDAIAPYVRRYLNSGEVGFKLTNQWIKWGALPLFGLGILVIYGAVIQYPSDKTFALMMGACGFKLFSLSFGLISQRQVMQATISLMAEFPLLHEEVEQVLTHMLEDYESLPEDMLSFEVGRATWEGMLNSEYAVFVSSDRVLFLARDEVMVQVSDSDISNSDEEVSISLKLCDQNMEAEMTTSDIRRLTMWIESE